MRRNPHETTQLPTNLQALPGSKQRDLSSITGRGEINRDLADVVGGGITGMFLGAIFGFIAGLAVTGGLYFVELGVDEISELFGENGPDIAGAHTTFGVTILGGVLGAIIGARHG